MADNRIIQSDALDGLRSLAAGSVQTIVTSPPYWGLRAYKANGEHLEGQWGSERTLEEYVERMVEFGRACRQALRDDGTLWLNLGDSYTSTGRSERKESPGVGAKQAMKAAGREVI